MVEKQCHQCCPVAEDETSQKCKHLILRAKNSLFPFKTKISKSKSKSSKC